MSMPPTVPFQALGNHAQFMSRECGNERLAMILQYVALGSFIAMTGFTASKILKDAFDSPDKPRGRSHH
ncbi:MAG: hypothetical protein U0894_11680 [Pirellulales bacterium]